MKVLIAGASGLVGSALIPTLETAGTEVKRMVRSSDRGGEIEWQIDTAKLDGLGVKTPAH
jgi:uncharacterized protein